MEAVGVHGNEQAVQQVSIMKNRPFLFLWSSSALTGLAFSIYLLTESWFVVQKLGLGHWLGIIMMLTSIPRVVFMVFGGVLADRKRRSQTMFYLNITRGVLIGLLTMLLTVHWMNIWWMAAFALLFGMLDAFYWPASNSLIPQIVRKEQIMRANSIMQSTNQFSFIAGPAIAGIMMKTFSFSGSFTLAAVFLMIGAIFIWQIKEEAKPIEKKQRSIKKDLKEGIVYVKGYPYLLTVIFTTVFVNFFLVGPVNIGLPLLVKETLKGDVLALSYLESSLSVGMVVGAVLTGFLSIRKKRAVKSLFLVSLLGITTAALSQITHLWMGMAIIGVAGVCLSISNIISPSLTQELVEPSMLGRVQSFMSTASVGFTPLSFGVVSILLSWGISITTIMLVSCCILTLFVWSVLIGVKVVWQVD